MEKFRSFSITYKGAKHGEDEPCQDASTHLPHDSAAIAVVADGHGSTRCFRSDEGSKKVVEIAMNCVAAFVNKTPQLPSEMTTQFIDHQHQKVEVSESKIVLNNVVREIINKWFAAVMKHEEEHPLKDDQRLEGITQPYKDRYINDVDYRCHAYGTTLMVAVMSENYWFGFHVGDGKCVVLYEDGSWALPIPWDDNCIFNVTTSICDNDSLSSFRYWFGFGNDKGGYTEYGYGVDGQGRDYIREIESRPLAIFVGSDGVEDSYPRVDNDKYVINFYRNRIVSLAESGYDAFHEEINGLAKRFADRESTDDVSIAGIIGDVNGKADMIAKMKHDSEIHEVGEMASVKRRDADEKKDALDAVEKRMQSVIASKKALGARIATAERERDGLQESVRQLNETLSVRRSIAATDKKAIDDFRIKINADESGLVAARRNQTMQGERVDIAEREQRNADKTKDDLENKYEHVKKQLMKARGVLEKWIKKATSDIGASAQQHNTPQPLSTRNAIKGAGIVNDVIEQLINSGGRAIGKRLKNLRDKVTQLESDENNLKMKLMVSKGTAEQRKKEADIERQKLGEVERRVRDAENALSGSKSGYAALKDKIHKNDTALSQYQDKLSRAEQSQVVKQAEINKLNGELETLKEQTKKQTDMLEQIKTAWEKAEAEAKALESTIRRIQSGGV